MDRCNALKRAAASAIVIDQVIQYINHSQIMLKNVVVRPIALQEKLVYVIGGSVV